MACGSNDPSGTEGTPGPTPGQVETKPGAETKPGQAETKPGEEPGGPTTTPPGSGPAIPTNVSKKGTLDLTLKADRAATGAVVSFGLPFPQGVFTDEKLLTLKNKGGVAVPISTSVLAKWPSDGSVRSVLVAFKATLAAGATEKWTVEYGTPSTTPAADTLAPNPDGPVVASLSADHYSQSQVSGIVIPAAANQRFSDYDAEMASTFPGIDFGAYTVQCGGSSARTYYDGPHARFQRFVRTGTSAALRSAREEAKWFRANELTFYQGRKLAAHKCQGASWTPAQAMDWGVLRQMYTQGMLDDYLLTGDPAAKEAVVAMGEAYRQNLPALSAKTAPVLEITERNLGWTLIGMSNYYALDSRKEVKDALASLVTRTIAWQNRGTSGALEHDIVRPDPEECGDGPKGASPFMTSLVADGLMEYWLLTGDTATVGPFMKKLGDWYAKDAITTDKKAFRYLWNCLDNPYDSSDTADLNLLIVHVFGAAYAVTKDTKYLTIGDKIADSGIAAMFTEAPKQWNQAGRSFGKYLGYRAMGATP